MDKSHHGRRDRLVKQKRHDTYRMDGKWTDPTICTECGCVYSNGRWTWSESEPENANKTICPACRRIRDDFPAGYIELKGDFLISHHEEITNLINNEEKLEKGEYPLERIMVVQENNGKTLITTTGVHIALRIGKALNRAYQGELSFNYGDGEKSIRVFWSR